MFRLLNKKKGQSTLEYAVLIIIIIGALMTIQAYMKKAFQGSYRKSADDIGDQFSPGNTNSIRTTRVTSNTSDTYGISSQGASKTALRADEKTDVFENTNILNNQREFWGKN